MLLFQVYHSYFIQIKFQIAHHWAAVEGYSEPHSPLAAILKIIFYLIYN